VQVIYIHTYNRFKKALHREALYGRYDASDESNPIDAVLYFISPHRFKGVDAQFLKQIAGRAIIIPILAKVIFVL
jgi:septin family protein